MGKEIGVYVHIPFCQKKCDYCDFISFCGKDEQINSYIEALLKEIKEKSDKNLVVKTIYIGGGTPSYINETYIQEILCSIKSNFNVRKDAEITIEVNPGTVSKEKLRAYKKSGVNRLSIGLQAVQNKLLKEIGRIHTYEDFLKTYSYAREIFNNINVDLMLALPNQTIENLYQSLEEITKLNPEHISVYSLILEENTLMYNKENLNLPDEETERKMYWLTKKYLEEKGYTHYEISNFSKPNYESKHNMDCWSQKEYIGFGLAASSYIDRKRFSNTTKINEYITNIENNNLTKNETLEETQSLDDQMKEFILLGLRKINRSG